MSHLRIRPTTHHGQTINVTPQSAGWTYVGFALHRLRKGDKAEGMMTDCEICLVFVAGKGQVRADGAELGCIGERMSPFDGKPWSIYIPPGVSWSVTAETDVELAVCSAPGDGRVRTVRVIAPGELGQEIRGKGTNVRHVTNILPESDPTAASLLVVEVITPGGHTSSYPPHKHDRDDLPRESHLEETYYHRINPPQGFAFQRVFTDADQHGKRELDEAMAVEDGDVVLVPKGYHPCAACHGYDLYYLNVMAGPKRTWKFHNAAEHAWMLPIAPG
jgi:5-deoxy-glucuronate isomerase